MPVSTPWCRHIMLRPLHWVTRQVLHGFNKMASTIYLGHDLTSPGAACSGEWSCLTRHPASAHAPGPYSWHPASLNPASLPSASLHPASRHTASLNPESWQTAPGLLRAHALLSRFSWQFLALPGAEAAKKLTGKEKIRHFLNILFRPL